MIDEFGSLLEIFFLEYNFGFLFGTPDFIFCRYMEINCIFCFLLTSYVHYVDFAIRHGTKSLFCPESFDVNGRLPACHPDLNCGDM